MKNKKHLLRYLQFHRATPPATPEEKNDLVVQPEESLANKQESLEDLRKYDIMFEDYWRSRLESSGDG